MRLKVIPEDFRVEEQIRLSLVERGAHLVCRVRKRGITTLAVQERLAARLGVTRAAVAFPALKDKEAIATQYASIALPAARAADVPTASDGEPADGEYSLQALGWSQRALQAADLRGNRFDVMVRDLSLHEAQGAAPRLRQVASFGVPNYFDEQRFGSYAGAAGFIGKKILQRDAEGAVRMYLCAKMAGDTERARVFKEFAAEHWGDWSALFEHAPKPSNFRSVLTYLKDHPDNGWRKALNLIPANLLALYLAAYQSWLWNQIVGGYLAGVLAEVGYAAPRIRVAALDLPVMRNLPDRLHVLLARLRVPLPNHQAVYEEPRLADAVLAALQVEGLVLNDFKARLLKKAFATRTARPLLVCPEVELAGEPETDELARRRWKVHVQFDLPPGSYATIVLKALFAA